jgi:hypothetical protein
LQSLTIRPDTTKTSSDDSFRKKLEYPTNQSHSITCTVLHALHRCWSSRVKPWIVLFHYFCSRQFRSISAITTNSRNSLSTRASGWEKTNLRSKCFSSLRII